MTDFQEIFLSHTVYVIFGANGVIGAVKRLCTLMGGKTRGTAGYSKVNLKTRPVL